MRRLRGPGEGQTREIAGEIAIGRDADGLQLHDVEASRRHAIVRPVADGVEVEDLGSSNGTFLDGQRIAGKVKVKRNASLRIGQSDLQIEIDLRSRRRLPAFAAGGGLLVALIAIGVLTLGGSSSTKSASAVNAHCDAHFPALIADGFPEPKLVFSHGGELNYTLRATTALISPNQAHDYKGFEYNNQLPGPTLVFCPGDLVRVRLENRMPLATNLHVHGLHVSPEGMGDNIFVDVAPLQNHQFQYQVPLDQSPGAFWYHPHFHGFVDPELAGGLAGAIVVEGGLDRTMAKIPQRLIVIQGGKEVPPNNLPFLPVPGQPSAQIHPPPRPGPVELLVNGVQDPTLKIAPGQIQRWRIYNATAERLLTIELPGTTFQVLAQDGITLRNMMPEKVLHIGPGSRLEVLVHGGSPGSTVMSSMPFRQCIKGCFDPFAGNPPSGRVSEKQALLTMLTAGAPVHDRMPSGPIGNPPDLRARQVDVRRTMVMARVPNAQKAPLFPINHKLFDPNRVDVTMKLNSVEQWTLKNPATGPAYQWHTFHIHQNAFQVVSIDGKPVSRVDWQDNVELPPGSTTVILIHPTDFVGRFVFHCHIAFHEDNGQMGVAQVLRNPTAAQVSVDRVMDMNPGSTGGGRGDMGRMSM